MADNTRYFAFEGQFITEHHDENYAIVDTNPITGEELLELIHHVLHALNQYESEGFRFVDVDGGGTISDGKFTIRWSDYGLNDSD